MRAHKLSILLALVAGSACATTVKNQMGPGPLPYNGPVSVQAEAPAEGYEFAGNTSCSAQTLARCQDQMLRQADAMGAEVLVVVSDASNSQTYGYSSGGTGYVGGSTTVELTGAAYRRTSAPPPQSSDCLDTVEYDDRVKMVDEMHARGEISDELRTRLEGKAKADRCSAEPESSGSTDGSEPDTDAAPTSQPSGETKSDSGDVSKRLLQLKALHDEGLISDEEYEAKRREILDDL